MSGARKRQAGRQDRIGDINVTHLVFNLGVGQSSCRIDPTRLEETSLPKKLPATDVSGYDMQRGEEGNSPQSLAPAVLSPPSSRGFFRIQSRARTHQRMPNYGKFSPFRPDRVTLTSVFGQIMRVDISRTNIIAESVLIEKWEECGLSNFERAFCLWQTPVL